MTSFLFISLLWFVLPQTQIKTGLDLVREMRAKHQDHWYCTVTFVQKTTQYRPDGGRTEKTWYQAARLPGTRREHIRYDI